MVSACAAAAVAVLLVGGKSGAGGRDQLGLLVALVALVAVLFAPKAASVLVTWASTDASASCDNVSEKLRGGKGTDPGATTGCPTAAAAAYFCAASMASFQEFP